VLVTVKFEAKLKKKFLGNNFFSKHLVEFQHFLTSPLLSQIKDKFKKNKNLKTLSTISTNF
jgi:hypothetical protein